MARFGAGGVVVTLYLTWSARNQDFTITVTSDVWWDVGAEAFGLMALEALALIAVWSTGVLFKRVQRILETRVQGLADMGGTSGVRNTGTRPRELPGPVRFSAISKVWFTRGISGQK